MCLVISPVIRLTSPLTYRLMSEDLKDNPLLAERTPIQFDRVKAEHVEPAIQWLLGEMKNRLADMSSESIPRTYGNILLTLDQFTEPLDFAMSVVRHLEAVSTYPELRAAYNSIQAPVSQFYSSIPLNAELWEAVKQVEQDTNADELAPGASTFS